MVLKKDPGLSAWALVFTHSGPTKLPSASLSFPVTLGLELSVVRVGQAGA